MPVTPYLFFDGRCEEALGFYQTALGAQVDMLMRFKEGPEPPQPGMCAPGSDDKIMHCSFTVDGTTVMASDGRNLGEPKFEGFALAISPATEADAERKFKALQQGGEPLMPLSKTFFAKSFGMVKDRFGIHWMLIVA